MILAIVILHVLVCVFLIGVILLQAGRGQGLSWGSFGGNPQSILGTKAATFLSRVTTVCAFVFLFTVIALNIVETRKSRSLITPQKAMSQVDFNKLKEALQEVEKSKQTPETPGAETPATTPASAVANAVETVKTEAAEAVASETAVPEVPSTPSEKPSQQ